MRGLVILVSVMTILIVVALGFVIYGINKTSQSLTAVVMEQELVLPKGSIIKQITGVESYLAVQVKDKAQEMIYFINAKSGKVSSKMLIKYAD